MGRTVKAIPWRNLSVGRNALLDFADLHGLVDHQGGIADRGAFRGRGVAGCRGEIAARALQSIAIAVAFGTLHGDGIGGDEFVHGVGAVIVEGGKTALGLCDLKQVATDTGEADGLGRGGASVGGRHLAQGILVDAEGDSDENE